MPVVQVLHHPGVLELVELGETAWCDPAPGIASSAGRLITKNSRQRPKIVFPLCPHEVAGEYWRHAIVDRGRQNGYGSSRRKTVEKAGVGNVREARGEPERAGKGIAR